MATQHTTTFRVEVDGSRLPDDVEALLVSALVDDSQHRPDLFELVFRDPQRLVLDKAGIAIGAAVRIAAVSEANPGGTDLVAGEVTALEAEYDPQGTRTIVRGLDHAHRLFRGRATKGYENADYGEIVRSVADEAGVEVGQIDSGPAAPAHVPRINATGWEFLCGLAREIGFDVAVADGKLAFTAPAESRQGPSPGNLDPQDPLQLSLGANLLRFRTDVTSAGQVGEVEVRGWDPARKQAVVGTAAAATRSADIGVTPDELAGKFGQPRQVHVDMAFQRQADVDQAASALAEEIASGFADVDGVAVGTPELRAGRSVSLGMLGAPFDGRYVVTGTRHRYEPAEGYTTGFVVSGRRDGSLLQLASRGGEAGTGAGASRIHGVVVGVVSDLQDPEDLGRVKLTFPWLSDDYVSGWARVCYAGAGADGRGAVAAPEVGDEVLVAFDHGDPRHPFVLGGLFNGEDKPGDSAKVGSDGKALHRSLVTRSGHVLRFDDEQGKEKITLTDKTGNNEVTIDSTNNAVTFKCDGDFTVDAKGSVILKAGSDARLEADGGALELQAARNLTATSSQNLELEATGSGSFSANTTLDLSGNTTAKLSGANAELSGDATTTVKGATVRIN